MGGDQQNAAAHLIDDKSLRISSKGGKDTFEEVHGHHRKYSPRVELPEERDDAATRTSRDERSERDILPR